MANIKLLWVPILYIDSFIAWYFSIQLTKSVALNSFILPFHFFKNSLDNLKEVIDEVCDDEIALIYNLGDEKAYLLDQDNNFTTL